MAYYYGCDWHDFPPDYDKWLEQTKEGRVIGAKVILTDKMVEHIDTQKRTLKSIADKLSYSFVEALHAKGQAYPREFKLDKERDASLRAIETCFLHHSEPKRTLQKYIYMIYHKALHDYAEKIAWETKPIRTKHRDWAINTKEYKKLESRFEQLQDDFEELKRDYVGMVLPQDED